MKNLKVVIVEDEILIAEDLKDHLKSFGIEKIQMAHNVADAQETIRMFRPDFVLLDIRIEQGAEGLDIGKNLKDIENIPFMYITAHSDMELIRRIVATEPIAYITKPFKKSDLFAAVSMAANRRDQLNQKSIQLKDGHSTIRVNTQDICYIESDGNYIKVFSDEKKYLVRMSLEAISEQLDEAKFFKIHRSFLVNKDKVNKFNSKGVQINGAEIPISRNLSKDFRTFMES